MPFVASLNVAASFEDNIETKAFDATSSTHL